MREEKRESIGRICKTVILTLVLALDLSDRS